MPLLHFDRHHTPRVNMRNGLRPSAMDEACVRDNPTTVQGLASTPTEPECLLHPRNCTFPAHVVEDEVEIGHAAPVKGFAAGVAAAAPTCGTESCGTCGRKIRVGPIKHLHVQYSQLQGQTAPVPKNICRALAASSASWLIRKFSGEHQVEHQVEVQGPGDCSSM